MPCPVNWAEYPIPEGEEKTVTDMLLYFIYKLGSVSKTKLIKLLYMLDLTNYKEKGETLTHVPYIAYTHGPFNPAILNLIGACDASKEEWIQVGEKVISVYKPCQEKISICLPVAVIERLDRIMKKYGNKKAEDIAKEAKSQPPFTYSKKDHLIDFELLNRDLEAANKLGIEDVKTRNLVGKEAVFRGLC